MTGINAIFRLDRWRRASVTTLAAAALLCAAQAAHAQLRWVEASDDIAGNQYAQNLFPAAAPADPLSTVLNANGANNGNDQVNNDQGWTFRDEGTAQNTSLGLTATVYESVQEDSPELLFRATAANGGVVANTAYNVYIAYWTEAGTDWGVRAGATAGAGANPIFNRTGNNGGTAGTFAGSGVWASTPTNNPGVNPLNPTPTPPAATDNPSPYINVTNRDGLDLANSTTRLTLGLVGTIMSNGSGQLDVYVDDIGNVTEFNQRAWFDGMAIVPASVTAPVFATASVDRATGALTFTNPTGVPLNIKSYSVSSPAGSLNSNNWNEIANSESIVVDAGWTITAPAAPDSSTTALAEQDDAPGSVATIPALTGTLNVGNVWVRSVIEDLTITLTLTDNQTVDVTPTFTGTALLAGDFDSDADIDVADFGTLRTNFGTAAATLATLSQVESYKLGDFTRDQLINASDFIGFRTAYDNFNGVGAFEAMVASIPEPSTGLLAVLGLGALRSARRRRSASARSSHNEKAPMIGTSTMGRTAVAALCLAAALATSAAQAQTTVNVTNWFARDNVSGTDRVIVNGNTNTFTVGDGTSNSANNTTVWAALPTPITVQNGQEVILRGTVEIIGSAITGDAMRFGLFDGFNFTGPYDPGTQGTPNHERFSSNVPIGRSTLADGLTYGWLGFLASANSGGGNGFLEARNPARTSGETQFISNAGGGDTFPLAGVGPATEFWDDPNVAGTSNPKTQTPNNRVIRLGSGASVGTFDADTYQFTMSLGRFGFENTISARLASTTLTPLPGDLEPSTGVGDPIGNGNVDGNDALLWQRGTPTGPVLGSIKQNFGLSGAGGPDYVFNVSATAAPSQDTIPTMITNEVDRVGILLSGTMSTDQANFTNVQLEVRQIQSLILDVNTNTGAVSVRNASGVPFDVVYYEMTSVKGNLNPGGWVSRDDGELGDPVGAGWDELGTPTVNLLAEGNLTGSQLVANGASFSLGTAFNTATTLSNRDTNFFFGTPDGILHRGVVNYNTISTVGAVPEPMSLGLMLIGLTGLAARRRKS